MKRCMWGNLWGAQRETTMGNIWDYSKEHGRYTPVFAFSAGVKSTTCFQVPDVCLSPPAPALITSTSTPLTTSDLLGRGRGSAP